MVSKIKFYISDFEEIVAGCKHEFLKGQTVCVTGAYGMIGRYLVNFLCYLNEYKQFGLRIFAVGRNKEMLEKFFAEPIEKKYLVPVVSDLSTELRIDEKIDYIFHIASLASGQYYQTRPLDVISPNILGTWNLLELSRKAGTKGFLYTSSGEVYGHMNNGKALREEDFGAFDPLDNRACYGESKRMGETLCKAFSMQYGLNTKIIRLAHSYGPTMSIGGDERVFSMFVSDIVHNRDICLTSDGSQKRHFTYLSDIISAMLIVIASGKSGEAYNACNKECYLSIKELAETLVSLYPEKNLNLTFKTSGRGFKEADLKSPSVDSQKIEALGWHPKISVTEGFKRTIEGIDIYE